MRSVVTRVAVLLVGALIIGVALLSNVWLAQVGSAAGLPSAGPTGLAPTPAAIERRLGLILGRAAAHEIGHYLLRSSTHARRGLMRARITDREFADPRASGFDLGADAREWLHARSDDLPATSTLLPASAGESAFNYIP